MQNHRMIADRLALFGVGLCSSPSSITRALSTTRSGAPRKLLGRSVKTEKGDGALVRVMYLSPSVEAGINTCKWAGKCAVTCLTTSGHMRYDTSRRARIAKTLWYHYDPAGFRARLVQEAQRHVKAARKKGLTPAVRCDGTSDTGLGAWLAAQGTGAVCYDYTKRPIGLAMGPEGYRLTFSVDEKRSSLARAHEYLQAGYSAAIVVPKADRDRLLREFPDGAIGLRPIVDGDRDDYRFADPPGAIVILYAKGDLRKVEPGDRTFIRSYADVLRLAGVA